MTDLTQTKSSGSTTTPVASGDGIVIDKNKTSEQYLKEAEAKYIVPSLVREKFPDLVKLIYETESMNEEERQYWLQILPIMTEEQIKKFADILLNEKQQLAKLDKEYEQTMAKQGQAASVAEIDEAKLREKMQVIKEKEAKGKEEDKSQEEVLLKQLNEL